MTAATVRTVGVPDPVREEPIKGGHHPLAFCEFCDRPVSSPLGDCDQAECRARAIEVEMYFVRLEDQ